MQRRGTSNDNTARQCPPMTLPCPPLQDNNIVRTDQPYYSCDAPLQVTPVSIPRQLRWQGVEVGLTNNPIYTEFLRSDQIQTLPVSMGMSLSQQLRCRGEHTGAHIQSISSVLNASPRGQKQGQNELVPLMSQDETMANSEDSCGSWPMTTTPTSSTQQLRWRGREVQNIQHNEYQLPAERNTNISQYEHSQDATTGYRLNKSKAVNNKIAASDRPDIQLQVTDGGHKYILSTGLFEAVKTALPSYYRSHDKLMIGEYRDRRDLDNSLVDTVITVADKMSHSKTLSICLYNTTLTILVNGKQPELFSEDFQNILELMCDSGVNSQIAQMNASIRRSKREKKPSLKAKEQDENTTLLNSKKAKKTAGKGSAKTGSGNSKNKKNLRVKEGPNKASPEKSDHSTENVQAEANTQDGTLVTYSSPVRYILPARIIPETITMRSAVSMVPFNDQTGDAIHNNPAHPKDLDSGWNAPIQTHNAQNAGPSINSQDDQDANNESNLTPQLPCGLPMSTKESLAGQINDPLDRDGEDSNATSLLTLSAQLPTMGGPDQSMRHPDSSSTRSRHGGKLRDLNQY